VIDVSSPLIDPEAIVSLLWETLNSLTDPLPHPNVHRISNWDTFIKEIIERCEAVITAIKRHSTLPNGGWLRLGGSGGLSCTLRLVEFAHRLVALKAPNNFFDAKVEFLRFQLLLVLPKEMWRRWALASMPDRLRDIPKADLLVGWQIFMDCVMRDDRVGSNEVRVV
jgi:hypothetical protein